VKAARSAAILLIADILFGAGLIVSGAPTLSNEFKAPDLRFETPDGVAIVIRGDAITLESSRYARIKTI
jgi:hypothetical protein